MIKKQVYFFIFPIILFTLIFIPGMAISKDKTSSSQTEKPNTYQEKQTETQKLNAWFKTKFKESLERSPISKTYLGIKDQDYGKWDNVSKEFRVKSYQIGQENLREMEKQFDYNKLDDQTKLSYKLFKYNADLEKRNFPFMEYSYPFNQMYGVQSEIPSFLINQHSIKSVKDAQHYIERLNHLGKYIDQNLANAQSRYQMGIYPPKFVYAHVIDDAKNVISGYPFETSNKNSPIYQDFKQKIEKLEIDQKTKTALLEDTKKALLTTVKPAYKRLAKIMKTQQAKASTEDGVWKLPNGDEYYKARLYEMTTTNMTPDEIHKLGLKEVNRIHTEMKAIMKKTGFKGSLQEFFDFMRKDKQFYYPQSQAGRDQYLKETNKIIENVKKRTDELFNVKPKAKLEVKAVEEFREKSAGTAFYESPALDGSRPGRYYANLYRLSDMPIYQMEALAYHEAIPGHHMQLAIAQELEGIPMFRRLGGYTAYIEGWGLYSEYLPKEFGFYQDPYSDFGRLAMELWRAARLVVDTGLHDKKWTREQAIDYLVKNTPNPKRDCIKAIERYIIMPGQATAYKIGMNKILGLREHAKKELGDKFDIRAFHDVVLKNGALPLLFLEENVTSYIQENK